MCDLLWESLREVETVHNLSVDQYCLHDTQDPYFTATAAIDHLHQ